MDTIKAWRCIGCGRLEAPANCIGICEDRKVELVFAGELAEAEANLAAARARVAAVEAILRRIAFTTPRPDALDHTWDALKRDARAALAG